MFPHNAPRLILADDHQMLLDGLQSLLQHEFNVIAAVTDGARLLQLSRKLKPDVIVTDIGMPGMSGMEVAEALAKEKVTPRMIFLTMQGEPDVAVQAFRLGVAGYVMKHAAGVELITAIHEVLKGRTFISPRIGKDLMEECLGRSKVVERPQSPPPFSRRQVEVLRMIAQGKTMKEVAATLGISTRTAEAHKYQMMERHKLRTVPELIRFGMQFGVVELPPQSGSPRRAPP